MFSIVSAAIIQDDKPNSLIDLQSVFASVLKAVIPAAGIVLFVVLMIAGLNWVMAGSDPKKAESARNMATYGILGLVALALSYLILRLIAAYTHVDALLNFTIYQP